MTETRPVRATEQLDWPVVEAWLRERLPAGDIPGLDLSCGMRVEQFGGGHSNLTYLIRFGDGELVLRRPPLGPVPPTAHDMAREFRWLSAVHPVFPRAPRAYVLCDDVSVAGSIFYVMERRHGLVVRHEEPPQLLNRPVARAQVSQALVDALVELHAVDVAAQGLMHLGKPAGFVARQVRGWTERWDRSRTSAMPEMDALARWLSDNLPPDPAAAAIVHGDFKLDNLMTRSGRCRPRCRGAGLGDERVGRSAGRSRDSARLLGADGAARAARRADRGDVARRYFSRDAIVSRYAERSGRDVSGLRFFEVFALFKIAVVVQQIYYRFVNGQTDDPRFANFGDRVAYLARHAADHAMLRRI